MNMLRANMLCHAISVTTRIGMLIFRVGADVAILHEEIVALRKPMHARVQFVEFVGTEGPIVLSPPDVVFGAGFAHDEFVVGRSAGVLAGVRDDRPVLRHLRFAAKDASLPPALRSADSSRRGPVPLKP